MAMFRRKVEKWTMPKIESVEAPGSIAYYLDLAAQYRRAERGAPFAEKAALQRMAAHYAAVAARLGE